MLNVMLRSALHSILVFLFLMIIRTILLKTDHKYRRYLMSGVFASLLLSPLMMSSFSISNIIEDFVRDTGFSHMIRLISEKDLMTLAFTMKWSYPLSVILTVLWIMVAFTLFILIVRDYLNTRKNLEFAIKVEDGIYECESVASPFVFGVFSPKIYIPVSLNDEDKRMINVHERMHIRYGDHIIKPLCLCLCMIYWFDPAAWLAYAILCNDLEISCDEMTIDKLADRDSYLKTLVALSGNKKLSLVQFEGSDVKKRVRRLLDYDGIERSLLMKTSIVLSVLLAVFLLFSYKTGTRILAESDIGLRLPVDDPELACGFACYKGHNTLDYINRYERNGEVYPLSKGIVELIGEDNVYGKYLYILHDNGCHSFYGHLDDIYVNTGDRVGSDPIGSIGNGGISMGRHVSVAFFDEKGNYVANLEELISE